MSTINSHFTFNYSQPTEYRLSHDSVFLAREIYVQLQNIELTGTKALDICAGAGVVGMDLLFHRKKAMQSVPAAFDFVEVQEIYEQHFNTNSDRLGQSGSQLRFLCVNYDRLQDEVYTDVYKLIVCNPPYFFPEQGKLSPSHFKNRCKFFLDSDLQNLMKSIANCLHPEGTCFMTLKELAQHGLHTLAMAREFSKDKLLIENIGEIRGTCFLRITKETK